MLCQLQIKMLGNLDLSKAFDQILDLIEKFLHNKTFFYIFVNRMSNNNCPISCYELQEWIGQGIMDQRV